MLNAMPSLSISTATVMASNVRNASAKLARTSSPCSGCGEQHHQRERAQVRRVIGIRGRPDRIGQTGQQRLIINGGGVRDGADRAGVDGEGDWIGHWTCEVEGQNGTERHGRVKLSRGRGGTDRAHR